MFLRLFGFILLALLGEKGGVDIWQDTTLGNGDSTQQLVQLLIVTNGQLKVTGNDTGLLVVTGSISSKLENFCSEVLKDGSQVDWGSSTNSLSIVSSAQFSVNTSDGELKSGFGAARFGGFCDGRCGILSSGHVGVVKAVQWKGGGGCGLYRDK